MLYNWQQADWPNFSYDLTTMEDLLLQFAEETGFITGSLNALPKDQQLEAFIDIMVAEAIKTSAIEGEYLSRQDVVSSIRNKLGINAVPDPVKDRKSQGAGELMVVVRNSFADPLSQEKLFSWHTMLMAGSRNIQVGAWRSHADPMQVISGAVGRETIHFEAPPSAQVAKEMERFITWFNATAPGGIKEIRKAPVRAAIAHLYFESIHPFEDGNGRIGRAIAEKALSQTLGRPVLLSLSKTIEADKRSYYTALESGQRSNQITPWIQYFVQTTLLAQRQALQLITFTLAKTKFLDRFKNQLNERQLKVILRMFDAGPDGFEGGMNAGKYQSLTGTSKATATRDLQELAAIGALIPQGGGRSTRYVLKLEEA